MQTQDAIGRRRQPDQNRGLRPLFPKLPASFESRVVRIAMNRPAWNRLDEMMAESAAATRPRAMGELIETLLAHFDTASATPWVRGPAGWPAPASDRIVASDWQDWQIRKERALLAAKVSN